MTIFITITNELHFSNEIIKYWKNQNICNGYKFSFLPVGLDEGKDEKILNKIYDFVNNHRNIKNVVVFSDAGLSTKLAKRIHFDQDKGINLFRSKGALIENGFLSYIMLNTSAPESTFNSILDDYIDKE